METESETLPEAPEVARKSRLEHERESIYEESRRCVAWAISRGLMSKPAKGRKDNTDDDGE